MKNKYDYINDIKDKVSIVEVISSYIQLQKKGNNFLGVCPFHSDSNPSLTVNEQKKIFKCFSCNVSGNVFSFVSKFEHVSYFDAILKIANKYNITIENVSFKDEIRKNNEFQILYDINEKANEYFVNFLNNNENEYAKKYLYGREIDEELIKYFNIGFAPKNDEIVIDLLTNKNNILCNEELGFKIKDINDVGLSLIDKEGKNKTVFYNRITIPIYDTNNKIVGFGARRIEENDQAKYINTASTKIFNKSELLFNLNNIVNNDINVESIYLVEGYMDVISLSKIGIKNVVATMGVAFTKNHLDLLRILPNLKVINICFDNDETGRQSSIKTAELINSKYMVGLINYQTNYKDIDELIKNNKEAAINQMNEIKDYTSFQIELLLKQNNITKDKRVILNNAIKILKKETDLVSINDNVLKLCDALSLDKEIILSQLNFKSKDSSVNKKFESKYKVDFYHNKNNKPKGFNKTEGTELEILTCIFTNRICLKIYEERCNVLLDENNNQIFNIVQDYYHQNPSINSIDIDLINEIFIDKDLIPYVMKIVLNMKRVEIKNIQDRLEKTLERHMLLLKKEGYKKIIEQLDNNSNIDEKKLLLNKIFSK